VLKGQGTLLQQSVQQSISLLVDHYDLEQPAIKQFIDGLQNIDQTNIERSYPSELQSAQPLKDLIEARLDNAFSNRKFDL
jgi:uroporphyrin-3 C-methyltransferase